MKKIFETLKTKILRKSVKLNKDLENTFNTYKTPIKVMEKNNYINDDKLKVLYIKKDLVEKDEINILLTNMNVKYTTIYLDKIDHNQIDKLKEKHKFDKIYFFIGNCHLCEELDLSYFVNKIILSFNITKAHYLFIYNPDSSEEYLGYINTLAINKFISKNKIEFQEHYNNAKKKIMKFYPGIQKINMEKKLYDLLIKIFLQKTKTYIQKTSYSDENDLIKKINEILYFISNLEFNEIIPEVFNNSQFKEIFDETNKTIENYIKSKNYQTNFENVFNDIKKLVFENDKTKRIFKEIKEKTTNFCFSYLKRCILDDIYNYLIDDIIPIISFGIFDEKIKNFLQEEELQIKKNNNTNI